MPPPITKTKAPSNTKAQSCVVGSVNVRSCLNFDVMWKAHPLNWTPFEPFPFRQDAAKNVKQPNPFAALAGAPPALPPPIYQDQCAIKMSIALQDGGLSLDTFPKARSEYREVYAVKKKYRGALAAEELANWLVKALGKPDQYPPATAQASVTGKRGIIFFKDFWRRPGEAGDQGDHMDLWDRTTSPMALPEMYGPGHENYFSRSKSVWFWELK